MGYNAQARAMAAQALAVWLHETASLNEGPANAVAHCLADRPELTIKRKAIVNTLQANLTPEHATVCFDLLIAEGLLKLKRGNAEDPNPSDVFSIHPPLSAVRGDAQAAGESMHFQFESQFLSARTHAIQREPLQAKRNAGQLRALDTWLSRAEANAPVPATMAQRAYEIFNDEKALDVHTDSSLNRLLKRLNVNNRTLHITTLQAPPLETFIPHGARGPLIVVENGDSFAMLRHALGANPDARILGERLGGVVYGAGSAVCTPHALDNTLAAVGYRLPFVLYWGDIDRTGVSELSRAREVSRVEIRVARNFYKLMVKLQKERMRAGIAPEASCKQSFPEHLDAISREIPLSARWVFLQTVRESKRIPQEIIQLQHLCPRYGAPAKTPHIRSSAHSQN